jgi:superfamily I DNA/RNA helicase
VELSRGQRAVVDHDLGAGPCRVTGRFGSGKSTALAARADRLRAEHRRPLLLHQRDLVAFSVDLLRRHGRPVSTLGTGEQVAMVASMLDERLRSRAAEVAAAVVAFQASFLGDEELRVHADAAGCLEEAEVLIGLTSTYLAALASRNRVDAGGALVQASLMLRDGAVLASEQARFDELLIDDFQLASFATNRLVSQLAGFGGAVTVSGNADAAVSSDPLSSAAHLERFDRRFGVALDVGLSADSLRSPGVPTLRLVDDADEARQAAAEAIELAAGMGIDRAGTAIVTRDLVEDAVSREWPLVIVPDATDRRWPSPRPAVEWFDPEVLHGPDLPDDDVRDRRWLELERRRFLVATSRATRFLVVIGEVPVSPFVGELVR